MKEERNLQEIIDKVKGVENGINSMIIPILKDTIEDYKKTFNKMVVIIIILIVGLLGVIGYSQYLIYNQNEEYKNFLSQFDFGEETVYQDLDTHEGGDITNSSITNN